MQLLEGRLVYSASDLNDYLECKHLTDLEALVARGRLERPIAEDPQGDLLRRKGEEHERTYLEQLRSQGDGVAVFDRCENAIEAYRQADHATLDAMKRGEHVIYQATFFDGSFIGHADFLRRVDVSSDLGGYSYEVIDTKLGLTAKSNYLVQLCNYSEHLARLQGRMPSSGYVVLGNGEERAFRLHDYLAYYRHLKGRFLEFVQTARLDALEYPREYPIARDHCRRCAWRDACDRKRRTDDHLSLVAWMRRDQRAKLEASLLGSVGELATAADEARPTGMSSDAFVTLRRQARLQVRGRSSQKPLYELLSPEPGLGFELLPQPAVGDIFFDMEGDPLYEPGRALEYLFGCWMPDEEPQFRAFWGVDRAQEKSAFEALVDFITQRRRRHRAMHVYHYANYEKSALRRLAQLHATREDEVDDLLRAEVLVDLYAVVRRAVVISEERYSIKNLERFYDFKRDTLVKRGDESIIMFEDWLLRGDRTILQDIERYNRDDCRSTFELRTWLLDRRAEAIAAFGADLPLRALKSPRELCHAEYAEGCARCAKRREEEREESRRTDVERTLLRGVLAPQTEQEYRLMSSNRRMRYLLGNLMAYHRREEKPAWWAYYDRRENVDQLLEFDKEAIAGLTLRDDIAAYKLDRSFVYTYEFPDQSYKLRDGDGAIDPRTERAVTILDVDADRNLIKLKTTADPTAARDIKELIPGGPPKAAEQRQTLARIAQSFLDGTLEDSHPATYDLLANHDPRLRDGHVIVQPERIDAESISAIAAALDRSYLFIQGPPGSGKSTIGSRVICDLLLADKSIAVTSTSHKAIHNLLHKIEECMTASARRFRGLYKHSTGNAGSQYNSRVEQPMIESCSSNDPFDAGGYQLAGGTAWLCSRKALSSRFDYLFIDEAGQVALADALAASLCARNVVLLGDPSQLAQVSQGCHPLHADDSVLAHLLESAQTVPTHRGIFLDRSYRMQPEICSFISDAMYEGRLHAAPSTTSHRITLPGRDLAGLYWIPIDHSANSSSSLEEADEIVAQIALIRNQDDLPQTLRQTVIVVTPYNAQRRLIAEKLRDAGLDVDVGTVDKFQGQEASIVFYSMATSSGEDVPRNVEFLFERNRFNVAISRARAACVLLCSPRLLEIACRTPEQMALANLLCDYAQRAKRLERMSPVPVR